MTRLEAIEARANTSQHDAMKAHFVNVARNDIPWLLARLREAERALEAVRHADGMNAFGHYMPSANKMEDDAMALVTAALAGIRGE